MDLAQFTYLKVGAFADRGDMLFGRKIFVKNTKLRAESVGVRKVPWNVMVAAASLERCCGVPMIKFHFWKG